MFYSYKDGINTTVCSSDELTDLVYNTVKYYEEKVEKLIEKNKQLYAEAESIVRKDYEKQINNLKEQLSLSYGEFASQKEKEAYNEFEKEHMHDRLNSKYNGGRAPYLIPTGTGVGTNLKVVCPICGESKDITDTSVW